ncbi:MAG: site-2 protease family protein [Gemmatimonadales bacterium]
MSWSFRLIRILGTEVKIHLTFVLLLAGLWIVTQRGSGAEAALATTGFILALFLCILLHEFGHILMARRFGIRTPDVILLPIGGVARLERMPEDPRQELLIALAGPAVTLVIAALLAGWITLHGQPIMLQPTETEPTNFLLDLMRVNVVLLVFNLIPAFPLDGGRVLRALLTMRMSHVKATRIAARIGQGLAMLLGIYGLINQNLGMTLIALFVFFGAGSEVTQVATRAAGKGILVDQMMITRYTTIPLWATLRQAVDLLLEGEQREFPVIDTAGLVAGLLTRDGLIHGLAARGPESLVREAMSANVPLLPLGLDFESALGRLRDSGLPALPVMDAGGHLVGLLTRDNIADLILVRQAVAPR